MTRRLPQLDFLRGIAVILVLFRHHWVGIDALQHIGWIGVDLFFVLSGFLVSGLLFSEYKKYGEVRPLRFLIRRGFKIYPLFYTSLAMTAIAVAWGWWPHLNSNGRIAAALSEIFFVQSYSLGFWGHHWSLAVEEHFYIGLALLFPWLIRYIRLVPVVMALCLILRYFHPESLIVTETHLRIDSLLMGVLISYVWHFKEFEDYYEKYKVPIQCLIPIAFCAAIFSPQYLQYTLLYIGFGAVMATLLMRKRRSYPKWIMWIGTYSYGIYLFHMYLIKFVVGETYLKDVPHEFVWSTALSFLVYFIGSILFGIAMSKLIEKPALAIRERFFPREGKVIAGVPASSRG